MLFERVFEDLNPEQLAAVNHGEGPLLIVAGAGSGKTMTLAARVGLADRARHPPRADPAPHVQQARRREMVSRAARLVTTDTGHVWGGTFHAVGNRLLRLHGRALGLTPDFTVLDQADGADVMNLLRDELGFSARERRFPRKDTLAAIYSRTVNAGERLTDVLKRHYPWCLDEAEGIREIFRAYTERKRQQHVLDYDDLLLFWKALATSPATAIAARRDVRAHPRRRVPGHERAAGRHPRGDAPCGRAAQPDRGRRRRAGDLRVPGGDRAEHPRVPRALPRRDDDQARTELPFDAADPGGVERGDRAQPAASREDAAAHATGRGAAGPAGLPRRGRAERRRVPGGPARIARRASR